MSQVPAYVSKVAKSMAGAQFQFVMSATIWAYAQQISGTPGTGAAMARLIVAEHPTLSEKTIANYCSTGVVLARSHAQVLASYWAEQSNNPASVLALFGDWIKNQAKAKGYTLSEPDLRAHADGKPSQAAKDQAAKDAQAAMVAAIAKAEAEEQVKTTAEPVTPAAIVATEGAKTDPVTLAPVPADAPPPADAPKADAPKADEPVPNVLLFTATRKPDGTLSMVLSAGVTREELVSMALHIELAFDALPKGEDVQPAPKRETQKQRKAREAMAEQQADIRNPADIRKDEPATV